MFSQVRTLSGQMVRKRSAEPPTRRCQAKQPIEGEIGWVYAGRDSKKISPLTCVCALEGIRTPNLLIRSQML
jgi:hypothetical protein